MYGPILVVLPAEKLAIIVMHEVLGAVLVKPVEGVRWPLPSLFSVSAALR